MITYIAKSSVISVTSTPTLLVDANRDRVHLEILRGGAVYFGGSDVSSSNGYITSSGTPVKMDGVAATAAVYGVVDSGTASVSVLEVIPDL